MKTIAQIPYFAGTVGNGKLYGYSSVKFRPGINHQETYTTFQYGLGDHFATGIDLYTGPDCTYWGTLVRYGTSISKWFNVGVEITPSFNLNNDFRFSYLTSALYLNGAISRDGNLFWCTNTWWGMPHSVQRSENVEGESNTNPSNGTNSDGSNSGSNTGGNSGKCQGRP